MERRQFLRVATAGGGLAIAGCNRSETAGTPSSSSTLAVEVPAVGLRDEPLSIRATGLGGYDDVTFKSRAQSRDGTEWVAAATFETGPNGVVTVGEQRPITSRYYNQAAPMGLVWAMRPAETDPTQPVAPDVRFVPPESAFDIALTIESGGVTLDAATTTRRLYNPGIEQVEITVDDVVGAAFLPPGDEPVPGVVHLHGVGGRPFRGLARLLASRGFATLALQYFGDLDPLPDTLQEIPVEYVERAIEWFRKRDRVADRGIGLFGFSRGGSLALLVATQTDHVDGVVGWVPSGVVYEGLGPDRAPAGTAAWTIGDEPVPYLELAKPNLDSPPNPGLPYFEPPLENTPADQLEAATIPVEDIEAPLYLVSVTDDQRWPSTRLSNRIVDRLDSQDYSYPYRHDVYDGAGHFMFPPYLPIAGTIRTKYNVYGGTPAANAAANAKAWSQTRSFLQDSLDNR